MVATIWNRRTGEAVELLSLTLEEAGIGPDDPYFSLSPIYASPAPVVEAPLPTCDPRPGAGWRDLTGE